MFRGEHPANAQFVSPGIIIDGHTHVQGPSAAKWLPTITSLKTTGCSIDPWDTLYSPCWEIQNTLNWNQSLQWQKKTLECIIPGCWNIKTVFRYKTRLREIRNSTVCKHSHLSWQESLHFESRKKEIWILSVLNKSLMLQGSIAPAHQKKRKKNKGLIQFKAQPCTTVQRNDPLHICKHPGKLHFSTSHWVHLMAETDSFKLNQAVENWHYVLKYFQKHRRRSM